MQIIESTVSRNIALDGIRGLAILLVIVSHAFVRAQPGGGVERWVYEIACSGWIGVELFFALSGYLITSILLRTRDDPGYFQTFYMRRILRIFPLYYTMVCLMALVSWWQQDLVPAREFPWHLTYLSNLRIHLHGWPHHITGPLWSLAVEEQFYLVWPAVILLLPRQRTFAWLVGIFVTFCVVRQGVVMMRQPVAVSVYTVMHQDGLLLGAALAAWHRLPSSRSAKRAWPWVAVAGCGVWIVAEAMRRHSFRWKNWNGLDVLNYTMLAVLFVAVIDLAVRNGRNTRVARAFQLRPLSVFGKYSYAMYMVHELINYACLRRGLHPGTVWATIPYAAMLTGASLLAAMVSWRLLEEPCLRVKERWFRYENAAGRGELAR